MAEKAHWKNRYSDLSCFDFPDPGPPLLSKKEKNLRGEKKSEILPCRHESDIYLALLSVALHCVPGYRYWIRRFGSVTNWINTLWTLSAWCAYLPSTGNAECWGSRWWSGWPRPRAWDSLLWPPRGSARIASVSTSRWVFVSIFNIFAVRVAYGSYLIVVSYDILPSCICSVIALALSKGDVFAIKIPLPLSIMPSRFLTYS